MLCQKCNGREATKIWSEGTVAYVHGSYQEWCDICVIEAQLAHAEERAAAIPGLIEELRRLRAVEAGGE